MSEYKQRDGDIVIYKTKEKRNEKSPDWSGKALIDGKEMDVAFWVKGSTGTMLAGSIKPKFKPNFDEARQPVKVNTSKFDDDLPW